MTCPSGNGKEWSHSLGDLPRKDDGLIVMGDLPKWNRGRVFYRDEKYDFLFIYFKSGGLIVMGDLPR